MLERVILQYGQQVCTIDFREGSIEALPNYEKYELNSTDWFVLESVVEKNHHTCSYLEIADMVWNDFDWRSRKKAIQNSVKRINHVFRDCLKCKVLEFSNTGYQVPLEVNLTYEDPANDPVPPSILTVSSTFYDSELSVIHREKELERYFGLLSEKKTTLLLSGFGGVGKTSLARSLYYKLTPLFNSVGWIEYHRDLRESILASFVLFNDVSDQEQRWNKIVHFMRNDRNRKLLVVDNVDMDTQQNQFPQQDCYLQEASGWQNTTVLITSRCDEIQGFQTCHVGDLGDSHNPEPCIDLFYFYFDPESLKLPYQLRSQIEAIRTLVEMADYHTYTIELLARSARYENDLHAYIDKIHALGFGAPTLRVSSNRFHDKATVAEQLRLLFAPDSRTALERHILWDFSVLPENITIPIPMVQELLSYDPNELDSLCREGWLRYQSGFSLHPLVKEVVHFDLKEGKAPVGTVQTLVEKVTNGTLISKNEPQNMILWKLALVDSASEYLSFSSPEDESDFFCTLGDMAFHQARRRMMAVRCLNRAKTKFEQIANENSNLRDIQAHMAELLYKLGHLQSATQQYRDASRQNLKAALSILMGSGGSPSQVAKVCDHLGYVLTDHKCDWGLAKDLLMRARFLRKNLYDDAPTRDKLRDYATTCDNLGFLMARMGDREGEELLREALDIRQRISQETDHYWTDVAWSAFNLGYYYSQQTLCNSPAMHYLQLSLDIRRKLEAESPGKYTANVTITLLALASHLEQDPTRKQEAESLIQEATTLWNSIGPEHAEFFADQITAYLNQRINS